MKKEEVLTTTINKYYCDFCEKESKHKCKMCGKDICKQHCITTFETEYGYDSGDYPDYYCIKCWAITSGYFEKCREINNKCDNETDEIMRKCKKECEERAK